MLKKLARLAKISADLREEALKKEALVSQALKGVGGLVMRHPGASLTTGVAASMAKDKYKQFKTGFDPEVQKAMMGQVPQPPGATT